MRVDSVRRAEAFLGVIIYTRGNVGVLRKEGEGGGEEKEGRELCEWLCNTQVVTYATMTLLFADPDPCSSHSVLGVIRDVYASWMILLRYQWTARTLECAETSSRQRRADAPPSAQLYMFQKCRIRGRFVCDVVDLVTFRPSNRVCPLTFESRQDRLINAK